MVDKKRLIKLTQELIRINSENPPGDESLIARFVQKYLQGLGFKSRICEFKKRRPNVIAIIEGKNKKNSLLITPHLDTVPAGKSWRMNPFLGTTRGNKIYGLGATDCKGNLACALEVLHSLAEDRVKLNYNLIFAATSDEESGSGLGIIPLLDKGILKPSAALVLDSDDFKIIVTQKGLIHLKLKIQGQRAHGAYPWRGENAIDITLGVLKELKKRTLGYKKNKYLMPPTMNIGTIKGGDKVNVVADWCETEIDFRFLPHSKAQEILKQLRQIVRKYTNKFKIEIEGVQRPYFIKESHPLVAGLRAAMRSQKIKPVIAGSEGATVITFFQNKSIPAVATGFGCGGCAHTADEYVKIEDLYKGAKVLEEFLKKYRFN